MNFPRAEVKKTNENYLMVLFKAFFASIDLDLIVGFGTVRHHSDLLTFYTTHNSVYRNLMLISIPKYNLQFLHKKKLF